MFSPKPMDMSSITLSWDQCVSDKYLFLLLMLLKYFRTIPLSAVVGTLVYYFVYKKKCFSLYVHLNRPNDIFCHVNRIII